MRRRRTRGCCGAQGAREASRNGQQRMWAGRAHAERGRRKDGKEGEDPEQGAGGSGPAGLVSSRAVCSRAIRVAGLEMRARLGSTAF